MMTATFPPESIEKALSAAEKSGVERAALLEAAGIAGEGSIGPLDYVELTGLYEAAARLTGDEAFGLHVGAETSPHMYGMLGYVAANSASFGESLEHLIAFQQLWTEAAGLKLVRERGKVRLLYWHKGELSPGLRRQESEQMLAALLGYARLLLRSPLSPAQVRFEHRAPRDVSEQKHFFGCPIVFGAKTTEIVFSEVHWGAVIPGADPTLGRLMKSQAESAIAAMGRREPFLDQIHSLVMAGISQGRAVTLEELAGRLSIGPRTIQRRLRARGATLRGLVEEVRMSLAERYLSDGEVALARIAHRLGYSQTSAFHRAFNRRTGTTPQRFRRGLAAREERR